MSVHGRRGNACTECLSKSGRRKTLCWRLSKGWQRMRGRYACATKAGGVVFPGQRHSVLFPGQRAQPECMARRAEDMAGFGQSGLGGSGDLNDTAWQLVLSAYDIAPTTAERDGAIDTRCSRANVRALVHGPDSPLAAHWPRSRHHPAEGWERQRALGAAGTSWCQLDLPALDEYRYTIFGGPACSPPGSRTQRTRGSLESVRSTRAQTPLNV